MVQSLDGAWLVTQAGKDDWLPAVVPGCIHTDLLAAGKIPDPFFGDNEYAVAWVAKTDWVHSSPARRIRSPRHLARAQH